MFAGAIATVSQPRGDLYRVRLLLVVLQQLGGACTAVHGNHATAVRTDGEELRRRSREQRRIPATALRGGRNPGAWNRAGGQRRRSRSREASGEPLLFLRRRCGEGSCWAGGGGRCACWRLCCRAR